MDLKQPVSLSPGKRPSKVAYPTKTTINLVNADQKRGNLVTQLGLFLIFLVLVGVFAKFAVVDPLASGMASSAEVDAAKAQLDALKAENANHAELNEKYERYVVAGLTEEEQNLASRDMVLDLLEEKVMNVGFLSSLKVTGNTAVVTCLGADLNEVSKLVEDLETDERVAHVTVSTAQGENDSGTSATIQLSFKGAFDAQAEGAVAGAMAEAAGTEAAR